LGLGWLVTTPNMLYKYGKRKMLEKLFTSKNRIKILNFLLFDKEISYVREISSKLKIPVSAVKREIDNLKNLELIKEEGRGLFFNKKNIIAEDLENIFIKTEGIIYPIKDSLRNINANFIIVFGSFAKGNFKLDSDVDLLVVGEVRQQEVMSLIKNAEIRIKKEVNPIVWSLSEIEKNKDKAIIKDILKNKKIFIRGDENEFRKIAG